MSPWIRVLEHFLVEQLLRTPGFHRAVEKVAKNVHRVRNGLPPEELGGTRIDGPQSPGFLGHFLDEVKGQLGHDTKTLNGGSGNAGVNIDSRAMGHGGVRRGAEEVAAKVDEMNAEAAWSEVQQKMSARAPVDEVSVNADAAWQHAQKSGGQAPGKETSEGFLGQYVEALRQQVRGDKKG